MEGITGDTRVSRRTFLGAAGALAVHTVASRAAAATSANDRLVIGTIGTGGQGRAHINWLKAPENNAVVDAVCDVYSRRREVAARDAGGCPAYNDYRRLLERKDIDAVTIATPDHWHAQISIDAMEAGKHVYCEKPMTLTWQEAKRVAETARRTGMVYQCGAQSASAEVAWLARDLIQRGAIGRLVWSQGSTGGNESIGHWNWPLDHDITPGDVDWEMWLGPAPRRPWSLERYCRFRKFWDYSGGLATDLLYHTLAHLSVALGSEFPLEVSAVGGNCVLLDREIPDNFHVLIKYPGNHTVLLAATSVNNEGLPNVIRGNLGTLHFFTEGVLVRPQNRGRDGVLAGGVQREDGVFFPVPHPGHLDHIGNWIRAIRGQEKPTLGADAAYRVMVAIHLAVLSYRQGKHFRFDPEREEAIA